MPYKYSGVIEGRQYFIDNIVFDPEADEESVIDYDGNYLDEEDSSVTGKTSVRTVEAVEEK